MPKDPTGQQLEEAIPAVNARIDDFLKGVVGKPPKEGDERNNALETIHQVFNVNLDNALNEYVKYQHDNFLTKRAKDLVMKSAIAIHKAAYIQNANSTLDSQILQMQMYPGDYDEYSTKLIHGLKDLLGQPKIADQVASKIMDFRNLNQRIPIATTNISYPSTQKTQDQQQPQQ
jgi:hypothetical protein